MRTTTVTLVSLAALISLLGCAANDGAPESEDENADSQGEQMGYDDGYFGNYDYWGYQDPWDDFGGPTDDSGGGGPKGGSYDGPDACWKWGYCGPDM